MFSEISFGKKDNISEVHNVPSTVKVMDCMLYPGISTDSAGYLE